MSILGRHLLIEYHGVSADLLDDLGGVEAAMQEAARRAGATIIHSRFHPFSPVGISGVVLIQESHLTIHTWPELGYAAVDVFTCGPDVDPWRACEFLQESLRAEHCEAREYERGPQIKQQK